MDVFLLGAGRPNRGQSPSALKLITQNTRALDWQLHSFQSARKCQAIHFLGGYEVQSIIQRYPNLHFTVIPDWHQQGILNTFFNAPFAPDRSALVSYCDTLFRPTVIANVIQQQADVVFCYDSLWQHRYEARSSEDIQQAETLWLDANGQWHLAPDTTTTSHKPHSVQSVEFTGLIYFSESAVKHLMQLAEQPLTDIGRSLLDVLARLQHIGLSVVGVDVQGQWAEFNSPKDIARFILGTKAETLSRLEPLVKHSHIGQQISFTSQQWHQNPRAILQEIDQQFKDQLLVVRSSSKAEDNWQGSNAGGFTSLLNIDSQNQARVSQAINTVIESYGSEQTGADQVLVQAFLKNVMLSGVVFSASLETGAPYYRFNFDDQTHSTESVTSGQSNELRTIILSRFSTDRLSTVEPKLVPVLKAVQELETLLTFDKLDIEFAIDALGVVHIFQVRPITVDHCDYEIDLSVVERSLQDAKQRFLESQDSFPVIYGDLPLFSNMSDWNPAEIIGTRPKPLAFSLYRHLITNDVWARQRHQFGYRDLSGHPLITSFSGQPYVDVSASLNSFIPADINEDSAKRIASAYLHLLARHPHWHDKIEFNIAFTIWTPNFYQRALERLSPFGVTSDDISQLEKALKHITQRALTRLTSDTQSITQLMQRRSQLCRMKLPSIDKIFSLIEDCRRYGTLAFAHAARAGFVANTWLNSFTDSHILNHERKLEFLHSLETVTSEFEQDKSHLALSDLVKKYGHLRPGTYDLGTHAYWEDPDRYFHGRDNTKGKSTQFTLSSQESARISQQLKMMGSTISVVDFMIFLADAIKKREWVKFEFSKNLSLALDEATILGQSLNITRSDMAFVDYSDLEQLKLNVLDIDTLKKRLEQRKHQHTITQLIELPCVLKSEDDFYCFERLASQPNFVTVKQVHAPSILVTDINTAELRGKIVLITHADPGYDWLFGYDIKGLITQYGGANSHMAIRAAEMALPAAIGVGDQLFEQLSTVHHIELDCANHIIRKIS